MLNFKIFGINIYVSYYFLSLITFLFLIDKTGLLGFSLLSIILHETGHILALIYFKQNPSFISFNLASVRITGNLNTTNFNKLIIALLGPLTNFLFSLFLLSQNKMLYNFGMCNLVIGAFNIIPAKNLDGGDILSLIIKILKVNRGDFCFNLILFSSILFIFLLGLCLFIYYNNNPTVLIVAIYLFILSFIKV